MNRPARLLSVLAGATLALGAVSALPAGASPTGPQQEQQTPHTLPPINPCQLHPWSPGCRPDIVTIDPCIQYPDGCPDDDGDDGGDETTTTTTQPEQPTDPTVPDVDDDDGTSTSMPTAAPATAVNASPTFTG